MPYDYYMTNTQKAPIEYDIIPITRNAWWQKMTLKEYQDRQPLTTVDIDLTKGLPEETTVWAFVSLAQDDQAYLCGLTVNQPSHPDYD